MYVISTKGYVTPSIRNTTYVICMCTLYTHTYVRICVFVFSIVLGTYCSSCEVYDTCDWWFLSQGPCPVYCPRRGRHYVGNNVVDESH